LLRNIRDSVDDRSKPCARSLSSAKYIMHVKERLGHRSLTSTLIYTQLISFESDEYHVRTAKTIKEDEELTEAGFEYVTDRDGFKIYRKRK